MLLYNYCCYCDHLLLLMKIVSVCLLSVSLCHSNIQHLNILKLFFLMKTTSDCRNTTSPTAKLINSLYSITTVTNSGKYFKGSSRSMSRSVAGWLLHIARSTVVSSPNHTSSTYPREGLVANANCYVTPTHAIVIMATKLDCTRASAT